MHQGIILYEAFDGKLAALNVEIHANTATGIVDKLRVHGTNRQNVALVLLGHTMEREFVLIEWLNGKLCGWRIRATIQSKLAFEPNGLEIQLGEVDRRRLETLAPVPLSPDQTAPSV